MIMSHTSLPGRPPRESTTRLSVNSYAIGPFAPSDTFRRCQKKLLRFVAIVSNVLLISEKKPCTHFSFEAVLLLHHKAPQPAECVVRHGHEVRNAQEPVHRIDEAGAVPAGAAGGDEAETEPVRP